MFFFNLSLGEFLALFAGLGGVVTALYLLDRARQKHRVATLRFWVHSEAPSEMQHRRKIQQPWSLLLQILSLLCLLLALAQLRWGSPFELTRDHVLILDSSAVMDARSGNVRWIDQARASAKAWLAKVPRGDRVMLVRADALATAATAFESNHKVIDEAITQTQPGASALRLGGALRFARQAQRSANRRAGEIVYAGAGHIATDDGGIPGDLPNMRFLPVKGEFRNVGLRKVGLRRSTSDDRSWEVYATVRNDGASTKIVPVALTFGGGPVATRSLTLPPGGEQSFTIEFQTAAQGLLETRLQTNDMFPDDDRAVLELPRQTPLRIAVFSSEPELLRPVFSSNARLEVTYQSPSQFSPGVNADVAVLDRFAGSPPEKAAAIYIDPPKSGSPVAIAASKSPAELTRWHSEHPLAAGLHARDANLDRVSIFALSPGDVSIADANAGPAIVARPSKRLVALGFHPALSPLRFELVTPLLFANILKWFNPDVFLRWELSAGSAGGVTVPLDAEPAPNSIKAVADGLGPVPFTVEGKMLRFFAGNRGTVRINDGRRELVYSLTLPEVATAKWIPPTSVRTGVPAALESTPVARDLWQWLALLGGAGLIAEWLLFGRARRLFVKAKPEVAASGLRKAS